MDSVSEVNSLWVGTWTLFLANVCNCKHAELPLKSASFNGEGPPPTVDPVGWDILPQ